MKILSFVFSLLFFWRNKKSVVPVVRLAGVISSAPSLRRGLSLESIEPQLKKAFSVRSAKAVALIINSPGGSPVQSALIGQRIRDLAGKADVPVLAFCEDVAASGGIGLLPALTKSMPMVLRSLGRLALSQPGLALIGRSRRLASIAAFTPLGATR